MWIFMSDEFFSVVAHRGDNRKLLVRARAKGDIERVFPSAQVVEGAGTDYRFRAVIPRGVVAQAMSDAVHGIDYDNFKDSVAEPMRHEAYMDAWAVMRDFQLGLKAEGL